VYVGGNQVCVNGESGFDFEGSMLEPVERFSGHSVRYKLRITVSATPFQSADRCNCTSESFEVRLMELMILFSRCFKMMFTTPALRWLEVIFLERFGQSFRLSEVEHLLSMDLPGRKGRSCSTGWIRSFTNPSQISAVITGKQRKRAMQHHLRRVFRRRVAWSLSGLWSTCRAGRHGYISISQA